MSIECNNTTPLASGFSSSVLTTSSASLNGLIDFSSLIDQTNPLDNLNIDRQSVVTITQKLNVFMSQDSLQTIASSAYPTLAAKFNQFPITYTEIADFILTNSVDTVSVISTLDQYRPNISDAVGDSSSLSSGMQNLLSDLDFYYNSNFGASISEGLCGQFGKIFDTLTGLFSLIDTAKALIADIAALDLDPAKLIAAIAEKIKIQAIIDKITDIIKQLIEKVKRQVLQAINSIIPQLKAMGCASKSLFKKIRKKKDEISKSFSDESVDDLIDRVKTFIGNMSIQYERLTLENVGLLMFKLCEFTELLQQFLTGPSKDLLKAAEVIAVETKIVSTLSAKNTKKAVTNGAVRLSPAERKAKKEKVIEAYSRKDTSTYLTDPCPTAKEIEIINSIDESGLGPNIVFSKSVIDNKEWQDVDTSVWSKLLRITSQTNQEYYDIIDAISDQESITSIDDPRQTYDKNRDGDLGITEDPNNVKIRYGETSQGQVTNAAAARALGYSNALNYAILKKDGGYKTLKPGDPGYVDFIKLAKPNSYTVTHGVKKKTSVTSNLGGTSNHIHLTGYAIDISINDDNREETIIAASRSGFTGIGVYKTFLHLDVGSRRSWVAGQDAIDISDKEKLTGSALEEMITILSTHDSDGFRKDRGETS